MTDFQREKDILQQITKAREAIRRKHRLLKQDKASLEKTLNETFKPIVDPLEQLVKNDRAKKKKKNKYNGDKSTTTAEDKIPTENDESFKDDISDDDDVNDDENIDDTLLDNDASFKSIVDEDKVDRDGDVNNDKYVRMLKEDHKGLIDKIFGVREEGQTLMIGNSPIKFTSNNIQIGDASYPKTVGLQELLFKREPKLGDVKSEDMQNYRKILETTNVHRKNYSRDQPIRQQNSNKCKYIIAPLFYNKTGDGILPKYKIARKGTFMDYVHWDDPNELVDRLRLLIAERSAGNNNHTNEIHSIIEELREAKIIY